MAEFDDLSGNEPEPALDAALRAAFEHSVSYERVSVLEAIARHGGSPPNVCLRDEPSDQIGAPLVDAHSVETRSLPRGKSSYELLGEIARGGMGVVLKGRDRDLGRDVALKVLRKDLVGDATVLQRFVEEAQIGGQLQHPGIVPVYELGLMADERPYFSMKLVKGRTLAALVAERTAPGEDLRRLLSIFEQVCHTIAYAHARGVVHRDLKPSNVMVGAFGEVQVVDWGLAKVLARGGVADERKAAQRAVSVIETVRSRTGSSGSHSQVGSVMGTPSFMSPEQARGEVEALDERSDVFALGAILCVLLTGAPPYRGEKDAALAQATSAALEECHRRLESCGADAELVVLAKECMSPQPGDRPPHAEAVARTLGAYLTSVEERAQRAQIAAAEARVAAREERRARRLTLALAGSVVGTLVLGGGAWLWTERERSSRLRETERSVRAALADASLQRGQQRWSEALASIGRAQARLEGETASEDLRREVASLAVAVDGDAEAARGEKERAAQNAALLAALADVRQPEGDLLYKSHRARNRGSFPAKNWQAVDASYREIMAQSDLDPDVGTEAEAAQALSARGIAIELASALDEWSMVRRQAEDASGAARLSRIASLLDVDENRALLRRVIEAGGSNETNALAHRENLAVMPAATLRLLASALGHTGAMVEATDVLKRACLSHPADLVLAMELARATQRLSPPRDEETIRYYTVAVSLRPERTEAWHELGMLLYEIGEFGRALELFREAFGRWPTDGHFLSHVGATLLKVGDIDGALASCRRAVELAPMSATTHIHLADVLYWMGDPDGALESYRRCIELEPTLATAFSNRSWALREKGDLDGAIASCRRALELDPMYSIGHSNLGDALREKGDLDAAMASCRRGIELDPKNADAHNHLGVALREKGDLDGALNSFRHAIELDPKFADAHSCVGSVLCMKGDFDGAVASCRRAIELDPKLAGAHSNLGSALCGKRDLDGAIASHLRAIELEPKRAFAHNNLGVALREKGDHDGAIASFRHSIELDPRKAEAHCNLGRTLRKKGDLEGAIESIFRALALDPKLAVAYEDLGLTLLLKGDLDGAIVNFRHGIELDPTRATAHDILGMALRDKGDLDGAMKSCRRAVELDPKNVAAQSNLGTVLRRKGDFDGAIESYRRALVLNSKNALTHSNLARALREKGDLDGAMESCRQALELDPKLALAHHNLGTVLHDKDDLDGAIARYQRALELDPKLARAYDALGRALREQGDLEGAIANGHRAVDLEANSGAFWNALGISLYRHGDLEESISALERSMQLRSGGGASDWLVLAMGNYRLGHKDEARRFYQRAVEWLSTQASVSKELERYRAEAEQVLGLAVKKQDH